MKTYYLYEMIDLYGTVEYVGYSCNPKFRMYQHTRMKNVDGNGHGRFYGRSDLSMVIVSEFPTRKEAAQAEIALKKEYGMPPTEALCGIHAALTLRQLTIEQAKEIRSKWVPYKYSKKRLSDEYGVSIGSIDKIVKNITYIETVD